MECEAVIGVEIHAELETQSKMFCACPRLDLTRAEPNSAVCPVCAGMPGVLPVVNRRAVEFALRVALALDCEIPQLSVFARKNYFYPDLPKGYQISQYEQPLARNGRLTIATSKGERTVRIRRVHMEEDTGKLTHVSGEDGAYTLVDLNRAGIALLEIVTEPDLRSAEEVRAYAVAMRSLLRYLEVNSGDLERGVLRFEPNVSVRPVGGQELGVRIEIKNLNSFRALEHAVAYEIQRQVELVSRGQTLFPETRGWNESQGCTVLQRRKEAEDDYRYFPEPDLPPLVVEPAWLEQIRLSLPELPIAKKKRFRESFGLTAQEADALTAEPAVANYFEQTLLAIPEAPPKVVANWILGELFSLLNQTGVPIQACRIKPSHLAALLRMLVAQQINQNVAKLVLADMFTTGKDPAEIVAERGLQQIMDGQYISALVERVLTENTSQVEIYLSGKETLSDWFFGQVMRLAGGQVNPAMVQAELEKQLAKMKKQAGK